MEQVVLVDDDGTPIGVADKATVHGPNTPRHLAFSCYGFDAGGRLLVTQRASSKLTFPLVWTNTCCGHPAPGETPADAATRRLRRELGLEVQDMRMVLPDFSYRASDGRVEENELLPGAGLPDRRRAVAGAGRGGDHAVVELGAVHGRRRRRRQ